MAAIEHSSRLEPETSIRRRLFTLMEYGFLFFLALPGPWDAFFRGFARGIAAAGGPAAGLPEIGAAANANAVMLIVGLTSLAAALLLNRRVLLGAKIRGGGVWWSGSRVVFQAALVDGSGQELRRASRPLLIRTLVTWIPAWLAGALLLAVRAGIALPESVWLLPPLLLVAGGLYALANPVQGIQDRIAGTYLVPR